MSQGEASARVEGLLIELGLEFAQDSEGSRFVVPTESGGGITVEFVPLANHVCLSAFLPLLRNVDDPGLAGYRSLALEQLQLLLAKLCYDPERGVVELRSDLLLKDLKAETLGNVLGAISQHSVIAEILQTELGGSFGPNYEELLGGE